MIFETTFEPIVEDYNKNGILTLQAILKMLENTGNRHSDKVGDFVIEGVSKGFAWILTDWKLKVDFFPKYSQKISSQTWIEKPDSPFAISRDLIFFADKKECARATTKWVLLDTKTKRLSKVDSTLISSYEPEEKTLFPNEKLAKISIPEKFDTEKEIQLRRSDFDFNNHVHNLCYLDFALETLPHELYENYIFKEVRITYKTALTDGRKAICRQQNINGKSTTAIYSESGTLCSIVELAL